MPSSCSLHWPFDVETTHQMWKEWLTVLGQHMVSNELTGAHHSQFWHFSLSPSASGAWIHPFVCPQLCVIEKWPSPSHLQKTEFFPCITNLSESCLWSYLSPMVFHCWLPSYSRVWLPRPVSVTSAFTSHTHSPRGKGIRLCLSSLSNSYYWAPCQTLGMPLSHTALCTLELLWVASAADKLGGVEQMGWTLLLERTSPPSRGILPDTAVLGSQSSPSQTTTVGLCSRVLLTPNPYTAKMLSTPSWLLPK